MAVPLRVCAYAEQLGEAIELGSAKDTDLMSDGFRGIGIGCCKINRRIATQLIIVQTQTITIQLFFRPSQC